MLKSAGFLGIEFEGAAAIGADVVVAALGLAGVDNFAAAALRTADDLLERLQRHVGILAVAISTQHLASHAHLRFPAKTLKPQPLNATRWANN